MATAPIRQDMTCCICKDIFTNPVTLRCGHSFCYNCISNTFDHQNDREHFCPECMDAFGRRPELQINFTLAKIAEFVCFEEQNKQEPVEDCSYCVNSAVPAVTLCLHCNAFLCEVHKWTHNKSPEHVLADPTNILDDSKCPIHQKILKYYCTVDDTFICVNCLTSDHNGHTVSTRDYFLQQKAQHLQALLEELPSKREEVKAFLQSLEDHRLRIAKRADDVTEKVIVIMRDVWGQQEDLEKRTQSEISMQREKISETIAKHFQQLKKEKTELHKMISQVKELRKNTNPLTPLQIPEHLLDVLDDQDDLYRDVGGKLTDDAGDLREDVIFETLHSGLSNIVGVNRNICVPYKNLNMGNRNVANKSEVNVLPLTPLKIEMIKVEPPTVSPVPSNDSTILEMLLDVKTASNNLFISDDLKTVSRSDNYLGRLESPERFQGPQVLSTRAISSGKHELEMEVSKTSRNANCLFIGFCYHSIDRRRTQSLTGDNIWGLQFGIFFSVPETREIKWFRKVSSGRIKTVLDYEAGQLSYYDLCDPITHLHTFSTTFTQPLYLIISIEGNGWVKILK